MDKVVKNTLSIAKKIGGRINFDGLENMLTGLGVKGRDKRKAGKYKREKYSYAELEAFHDSSDIAKIVVNKVPELATKKWITHKVGREDGGVDMANQIVDEYDRLMVKGKFQKAMKWGRLYGGAGIYISVADGMDPKEPLNLNRVRQINSLTVLHKEELHRQEIDYSIDSPNFGLPKTYTVGKRTDGDIAEVHHSRILRFPGSPLSEQGFSNNDYWDDSVLTTLYQIAADYDSAYNGVLYALQDFDIDILKLNDLADIVAADDDKLIQGRLKLMQLSKSIMSSILIDAENEDFQKLQRQFSNVDKVLEKIDRRLQMATDLPHTVLFGDGSTGNLSGAGESEQNTLNDLVAGEQDKAFTDNINYLQKIVFAQKQRLTRGRELKTWTYAYNKLNEPTEKETALTRKAVAETDNIYFQMGAMGAMEIAKSRFGGDEYSMETSIDLKALEEQEETDLDNPDDLK